MSDFYILLVEDDKMNQRVASLMLQEWGCRFDIAENGLVAVQKVAENKYDLVLMDIRMPELDGVGATKQIREKVSQEELPIIAMTAHAFGEEIDSFKKAGMNDVINKPVTFDALNEMLLKYLSKENYTPRNMP